jgi:hypothetical protein
MTGTNGNARKRVTRILHNTCQYIDYSTTRQDHMITYLHPPVRMSPDVLYQIIIFTFRTPIDTPSDLSEFDIERLELRLPQGAVAGAFRENNPSCTLV